MVSKVDVAQQLIKSFGPLDAVSLQLIERKVIQISRGKLTLDNLLNDPSSRDIIGESHLNKFLEAKKITVNPQIPQAAKVRQIFQNLAGIQANQHVKASPQAPIVAQRAAPSSPISVAQCAKYIRDRIDKACKKFGTDVIYRIVVAELKRNGHKLIDVKQDEQANAIFQEHPVLKSFLEKLEVPPKAQAQQEATSAAAAAAAAANPLARQAQQPRVQDRGAPPSPTKTTIHSAATSSSKPQQLSAKDKEILKRHHQKSLQNFADELTKSKDSLFPVNNRGVLLPGQFGEGVEKVKVLLQQNNLTIEDVWKDEKVLKELMVSNRFKMALEKILEQKIEQRLQSQKLPPGTSPTPEKLQEATFYFRPSETSPNTIAIFYAIGEKPKGYRISKEEFYKLYLNSNGDPKAMRLQHFDKGNRKYLIDIDPKELETSSTTILHELCQRFSQYQYENLFVYFKGQEGIDMGGLGRQFTADLVSNLCKQLPFEPRDNGLLRPKLKEGLEGFTSLTPEEKQSFREVGMFFMFCLNSTSYPIGQVFDGGMLSALKAMPYLDRNFEDLDFNNEEIFNKMFSIYKQMNNLTDDDINMIKVIERSLSINASSTDDELLEAYSLAAGDPEIEKLNLGMEPDPSKLRVHMNQIKHAVQQSIIQNNLKPTLAPLHEIARGMNEAPFKKVSMSDVQQMSTQDLSSRLQGVVTKEMILQQLVFKSYIDPNTQNWIKDWIIQADDQKLQQFLYAVTGSPSLASDEKITIAIKNQVFFHTCFNMLDVPPVSSKEELFGFLDAAVAAVNADKKFDSR